MLRYNIDNCFYFCNPFNPKLCKAGAIKNAFNCKEVLQQLFKHNLYINLACLSVWVSVCLYPINVKTAEPIGTKFCVGHHVTPGKVYE